MNNKEFISELSSHVGDISQAEIQKNVNVLIKSVLSILSDENSLAIQGFGIFSVKKRLERVVLNPRTKQKMLVPPKMVLVFKPSLSLKDKVKE